MTDRKLTKVEEEALWEEAARRLSLVDIDPPISMEVVDRLLKQLPQREDGESHLDRLRRASRSQAKDTQTFAVIQLDADGDGDCVVEDRPAIRKRLLRFKVGVIGTSPDDEFTPITEFVRMAAADDSNEIKLPDAGRSLESPDGRFRVGLNAKDGKIEIAIEALGFATDEFAHKRVGLASLSDSEDDSDVD